MDQVIADSPERKAELGRNQTRRAVLGVFFILLASFAFFWHSRDWNSASRLMLTYSLGDRGSISIDGLHTQTFDLAKAHGHFYSDKQPGFSFFALPIYIAARAAFALPSHPVQAEALSYWPADYWLTLGTSGVATAFCGALLSWVSMALGCGPRRGILIGLAYGLGTPAYVYATLAYGHQLTATLLLTSLLLAAMPSGARPRLRTFLAGLLSACAVTVELSAAPVAAVVIVLVLSRMSTREWPPIVLLSLGTGAALPLLLLLLYNTAAFGSPLDIGYAHHVVPRFRAVHGGANPLGLRLPRFDLLGSLLFGEYRGLFVYAPITLLAPFGWIASGMRAHLRLGLSASAAFFAVVFTNLSYPEWTGGWCTGPRLLVTALPFAMVGVAMLLSGRGPVRVAWTTMAVLLAVSGGIVNLGCQGVGGRLPDTLGEVPLDRPLSSVVLPLWSGSTIPVWWVKDSAGQQSRFERNAVSVLWPGLADPAKVPASILWQQFVPLLAFQLCATVVLLASTGDARSSKDHAARDS
jgi:hypothetical protein